MKRHVMPGEEGDSVWFARLNPFQQLVTRRQVEYKRRLWPGVGDGAWSKDPDSTYPHILPTGHRLDAFYEPIAVDAVDYCEKNKIQIHSEALNLKSSQVCCFNFLFPLRKDLELAAKALGTLLPGVDRVTAIEFEYTGPDGATEWLGEPSAGGRGRNRTSIDAAIWWESKGQRHLTLVEWKYTERGYGSCGGYVSKGNKTPECCDTMNVLADDEGAGCYLTQGRNNRRYWDRMLVAGIDMGKLGEMKGCPFKGPFYQLMRQHLLAAYIRTTDANLIVDVAAVNFRGNESVITADAEVRKLAETVPEAWNRALSGVPKFRCVEAETIAAGIAATSPPLAAYLNERYGV